MLRKATALLLLAACAVHAQTNNQTNNPETLAERSQATARAVLDRAVAAIGGAEALRSIEVVRLQLEGENWPRLQMPTAAPPFEAGTQQETLLLDLKNNRLRLEQRGERRRLRRRQHDRDQVRAGRELRSSRAHDHADSGRAVEPAAVRAVLPPSAAPAAASGARSREHAALARAGHVRRQAARCLHVRHGRHAAGRGVRRLRERPGVEVRADLRRSVHRRGSLGDHVRRLHARRQFPGAADLEHAPGRRRHRRGCSSRSTSIPRSPTSRSTSRRTATRASRRCPTRSTRRSSSSPTACS